WRALGDHRGAVGARRRRRLGWNGRGDARLFTSVCLSVHPLGRGEGNAILRTLRSCQARNDRREIELEHVGEERVGRVVGAEQALRLAVGFDERDLLVATTRESQIL